MTSLWCGGGAMNHLNPLLHSHFYQESALRNLSEMKFLANPRSLLDIIEWLVGIQECLECCNILLPSYDKPMMWWWSNESPQPITTQPFLSRKRTEKSYFQMKFLANPRSLLVIIEWLVGIQECLECCNILLTSCTKPLMWWWSNERPQLTTTLPFLSRKRTEESYFFQMKFLAKTLGHC